MASYCVRCKEHTPDQGGEMDRARNGRLMKRSICGQCGGNKVTFVSERGGKDQMGGNPAFLIPLLTDPDNMDKIKEVGESVIGGLKNIYQSQREAGAQMEAAKRLILGKIADVEEEIEEVENWFRSNGLRVPRYSGNGYQVGGFVGQIVEGIGNALNKLILGIRERGHQRLMKKRAERLEDRLKELAFLKQEQQKAMKRR